MELQSLLAMLMKGYTKEPFTLKKYWLHYIKSSGNSNPDDFNYSSFLVKMAKKLRNIGRFVKAVYLTWLTL